MANAARSAGSIDRRASANATAGGRPAASAACTPAISGWAATSEMGATAPISVRQPSASRVAVYPISSSPAPVAETAESHAESRTSSGAFRRRSSS